MLVSIQTCARRNSSSSWKKRSKAFVNLILRAYSAEKTDGFTAFQGVKAGRLVAVGPVNLPVTRLFIEEIILECRKHQITRVDILGFEFEMGLFPNLLDEAQGKGIDLAPKYIPAEVFDKRAVDREQVVFHDVAFIEVKPLVNTRQEGHTPYRGGGIDRFFCVLLAGLQCRCRSAAQKQEQSDHSGTGADHQSEQGCKRDC